MLYEDRYDLDKMEAEVDAEQYIGEKILQSGHASFLPLANSIGMEESDLFTGPEFVGADLTIIRSFDPNKAIMVMRPGWRNGSMGARAEHDLAEELKWGIFDMDQYPGQLGEYLAMMLHSRGPLTVYVSGKYRHMKEEFTGVDDATDRTGD